MKDEIPAFATERETMWTLESRSGESYNVTLEKPNMNWVIEQMEWLESPQDWTSTVLYSGPHFKEVADLMKRCGVERLLEGSF